MLNLLNTTEIEIWPASILQLRSSRLARWCSHAHSVLRRKKDGYILAMCMPDKIQTCLRPLAPKQATDYAIKIACCNQNAFALQLPDIFPQMEALLHELEIDPTSYQKITGLEIHSEPGKLFYAGQDRFRRAIWLTHTAALAWRKMQRSAAEQGIILEVVSAYRSHYYQKALILNKRRKGQSLTHILGVNAAPGFSEHHSGRAVDLSTPDFPAATQCFEHSEAFSWLQNHAAAFGFSMTYPRHNPHNIQYEPWHWCHHS